MGLGDEGGNAFYRDVVFSAGREAGKVKDGMDANDWKELTTPLLLAIAFGVALGLGCLCERICKP